MYIKPAWCCTPDDWNHEIWQIIENVDSDLVYVIFEIIFYSEWLSVCYETFFQGVLNSYLYVDLATNTMLCICGVFKL